jgi:hypothetical protein
MSRKFGNANRLVGALGHEEVCIPPPRVSNEVAFDHIEAFSSFSMRALSRTSDLGFGVLEPGAS